MPDLAPGMIKVRCDGCRRTDPVNGFDDVDLPIGWIKGHRHNETFCPRCTGAYVNKPSQAVKDAVTALVAAVDVLMTAEVASADQWKYKRIAKLANVVAGIRQLYATRVKDVMANTQAHGEFGGEPGEYTGLLGGADEEVGYGVPLGAGGYGAQRNDAVSLTREAIMAAVSLQAAPKAMHPIEQLSTLVNVRETLLKQDPAADVAGFNARIATLQAELSPAPVKQLEARVPGNGPVSREAIESLESDMIMPSAVTPAAAGVFDHVITT